MKVVILTENILSFLPLINKVLPSHSQIPILSNVLLDANENGFFIRTTDLEIGAQVKIPAKIESMGAVTIPGKEFVETINSLPKDKLTMALEKDVLTLLCRGNKVTFNTIPHEEFPKLFKEKGEEVTRFTKKEFLDIFSSLIFSVSQEETRPQLTGIYIDSREDRTNFVSTDGYRMSIRTIKTQQRKIRESLIVAVRLINEVISLKSENEIILYINKGENQVVFEVGNVIIVGRMIEEKFPDYEGVLPTKSQTTVLFDREELLQNVRLVAVFAKDASNITSLEISGDEMKLLTRTQGVGEGETTVECQKTGEDNKISFNIKYLLDVLKNVSEEELELRLNSPTEPAVFGTKDKNFLHVIMPIQVD